MVFEQQEQLIVKHLYEHHRIEYQPLSTIDHSCTICYPQPQAITVSFQNFWNWIETYHFGESFTLYTVQALHIYFQAFERDSNTNKSQQVINLAVKLFLSIRYLVRPTDFQDILFFFLNFTYRTNYFKDPVTPEIINNFNNQNPEGKVYTFTANTIPNVINSLNITVNKMTAATNDQIKTIMENIFGVGGVNFTNALNALDTSTQATTTSVNNLITANQNRMGSKIVEVPPFHGKDNEDPYEWCQLFEQAHAANGWPDARKVALAAGHLRDAARDWYEQDHTNIVQWHIDARNDNFDDRLKNYFSTAARKNQWTRELQGIKQLEGEAVEDYARRFRKLLRKATQGDALAARYQVNYFVNGLSPLLVSQVVLGNTDTLAAAIERAKLVETGVKYTLINSGILPLIMPAIPVTPANVIIPEIPTKTIAQIKTPVDPVDEITKQLQ